jgi:hypothetical protein
MFNLSIRNTTVIAIVLAVVMMATRDHHAAAVTHLPDASWAIFFMLGFYFRNRMLLPLFMGLAALIDYVSISHFGINDYCVTAAYVFLLPSYSALWMAGRWYAAHHRLQMSSLPLLAIAATVGAAACEVISSSSFYFLGGRFADATLSEFVSRLVQYFPTSLAGITLYLGLAALVHVLISSVQHSKTILIK